MINRVAISMVNNPDGKRFLDANKDQIIAFASTPDTRWKDSQTADAEKPMHWFQMDRYGTTSMGEGVADLILGRAQQELGQDFVKTNGLAMWRISDMYAKLVQALKTGDFQRAVQVAGTMGHYVGDMTQPMHSTSNYDGQSIHHPGVHKYYETTLVDHLDAGHLYDTVLASAGERRTGLERSIGNDMDQSELQHAAYSEAEDAFTALNDILGKMDSNHPDDAYLTADLQPRLARASALLGKILDVAFTTSGVQNLPTASVNASEPSWISMN